MAFLALRGSSGNLKRVYVANYMIRNLYTIIFYRNMLMFTPRQSFFTTVCLEQMF